MLLFPYSIRERTMLLFAYRNRILCYYLPIVIEYYSIICLAMQAIVHNRLGCFEDRKDSLEIATCFAPLH